MFYAVRHPFQNFLMLNVWKGYYTHAAYFETNLEIIMPHKHFVDKKKLELVMLGSTENVRVRNPEKSEDG